MNLAFIVLAHRDPENVVRLVSRLVDGGSFVALHYDLKAAAADHALLRAELGQFPNVVLADPVEVLWGQWSIVLATLNAIEALQRTGRDFDYVHLMSGMDYPIKPIEWLEQFLATAGGHEFIEAKNINRGTWVQGGLEHERYTYRHVHNWQAEQKKFDKHWTEQQKRKRVRKFIADCDPYLGSQWWTLTWNTCQGALAWSQDPAVRTFFESVWIPDEMFFQTYVGNNISPDQIWNIHLTYYQFDPKGVPVVFYDDHLNYLISQGFFFARKIHRRAIGLRDGLDRHNSALRDLPLRLDEGFIRRTPEYSEFIDKHRWGLRNRRQVGYAGDQWYGDLHWNRAHYMVIVTASETAAERVRAAIEAHGVAICHGELFARKTIEFADGRDRFAGYGKGDIALRDQKRQNFLVDMIRAAAPRITSFVWTMDNSSEFQKVLIWDPRAHFVFAPTDIIDAFLDEQANGPGHRALGQAEFDETIAFTLLSRRMLVGNDEFRAFEEKLRQANKTPHVAFGQEWRQNLQRFLSSIIGANLGEGIDTPSHLAQPRSNAVEIVDSSNAARFLRLIASVPTVQEQERLLSGYFHPVKDRQIPYVVLFASSPIDKTISMALSRAIPKVPQVTVVFAPVIDHASAQDGEAQLGADFARPSIRPACTIVAPRYQLDGVGISSEAALFSTLVDDRQSILLLLRNKSGDRWSEWASREPDSANAVSPEMRQTLSQALAESADQFERQIYELARTHRKGVWTVEMGGDWRAEFKSFAMVIAQKNLQSVLEAAQLEEELDEPQRPGAPAAAGP